jgi:hypothetical protein
MHDFHVYDPTSDIMIYIQPHPLTPLWDNVCQWLVALKQIITKASIENYINSWSMNRQVSVSKSRIGEVYSIQHYVIKFVSDLRQIGGFLRVLRFASSIKEKTGEPVEKHRPAVSDWYNVVSSTLCLRCIEYTLSWARFELTTDS